MSNPNPFVPKGSLLEQQSKRRSNLKIAVSCVLAVGVVGLVALLIQGCKRDTGTDNNLATDQETNNPPPIVDTNAPVNNPPVDTNPVVAVPVVTNPVPPVIPQPPAEPVAPVVNTSSGTEYIVVAGDTLGKIAHRNGVSLKALEAANPDVNPKHLKVKQKLIIPAGSSSSGGITTASSGETPGADLSGETTYTVKSGDTLHKIAKKYTTTVKAIEAENNLSTTKIKVGQKLKIPAKAAPAVEEAAPAAPATVPALPAPAPVPTSPTPAAPGAPGTT